MARNKEKQTSSSKSSNQPGALGGLQEKLTSGVTKAGQAIGVVEKQRTVEDEVCEMCPKLSMKQRVAGFCGEWLHWHCFFVCLNGEKLALHNCVKLTSLTLMRSKASFPNIVAIFDLLVLTAASHVWAGLHAEHHGHAGARQGILRQERAHFCRALHHRKPSGHLSNGNVSLILTSFDLWFSCSRYRHFSLPFFFLVCGPWSSRVFLFSWPMAGSLCGSSKVVQPHDWKAPPGRYGDLVLVDDWHICSRYFEGRFIPFRRILFALVLSAALKITYTKVVTLVIEKGRVTSDKKFVCHMLPFILAQLYLSLFAGSIADCAGLADFRDTGRNMVCCLLRSVWPKGHCFVLPVVSLFALPWSTQTSGKSSLTLSACNWRSYSFAMCYTFVSDIDIAIAHYRHEYR